MSKEKRKPAAKKPALDISPDAMYLRHVAALLSVHGLDVRVVVNGGDTTIASCKIAGVAGAKLAVDFGLDAELGELFN